MKKLISLLVLAGGLFAANAQNDPKNRDETEGQNGHRLREVEVIASRIVNTAEGYTVNLRGADIAKGKPAAQVLPFLPNVSRENGSFKINGLPVSEIYVDGVRLEDISELGNIPGERIAKVEVRYLAGADQSASLSGGNIFITLRRPPEGGYYGSMTAEGEWRRAGGLGNGSLGGMVNYRYRNLSVYDNLHIGAMKLQDNAEQWITGPDSHIFLTETTESTGFNFRNRLSLNGHFKSGAQLGGSYTVMTSRQKPTATSIQHPSVAILQSAAGYAVTDASGYVIDRHDNTLLQQGTLKFAMPFKRKGSGMELMADYLNRHSDDKANYSSGNEAMGENHEKNNLNLWKVKADFTYPASKALMWKFGASAQWIASSFTPSSVTADPRFELSDVPTRTSGFTPIVYASAQGMFWKLRYSAGVNWQQNRITYQDRSNGMKDTNTQWAVNPTLQVMMPFGAKRNHALMLNYKHTLNQIPYSAISSVIRWEDAYNYTVGNPRLKAQSADMVMAGLSLCRNRINLSLVYARSHNEIYWQTFRDADNHDVYYRKPVNIDGRGMWGVGAEWVESPAKWWRFKLSGRVEISAENTVIADTRYGKTRWKEYFSFNNNFTFSESFGGMIDLTFEPTYRVYDRTYRSVYSLTGRLYKTFLADRLQVALDFTPLGNRRRLDRQVGSDRISYRYTSPVQHVGVSVTWNFSGGKRVKVTTVEGIQDYNETKDTL